MNWLIEIFETINRPVDQISLGIGAICVVFAMKQYLDQRETLDKLKVANKTLTDIREGALTTAVARFPYNLRPLTEFINQAESELFLMADFLGYAVYSNQSGYVEYFAAVQQALKRGVEISLLLYGLDTARQAISRQLPSKQYPEERDTERCKEYFKRLHQGKLPPSSYNEFRDTLLRDEEILIAKLPGVRLRVVSHNLLAFCWIRDQATATVFALRNDGEDEAGMSFMTKDPHICMDFQKVFKSEWERAEDTLYKGRW